MSGSSNDKDFYVSIDETKFLFEFLDCSSRIELILGIEGFVNQEKKKD